MLWFWYDVGNPMLCCWYAAGMLQCCWYAGAMQLVYCWYAAAMLLVCSWYATLSYWYPACFQLFRCGLFSEHTIQEKLNHSKEYHIKGGTWAWYADPILMTWCWELYAMLLKCCWGAAALLLVCWLHAVGIKMRGDIFGCYADGTLMIW